MLAILVRENVISSQISSISSGMMKRGAIQIAITVVVMLLVFSALIYQSKKAQKLFWSRKRRMETESGPLMRKSSGNR